MKRARIDRFKVKQAMKSRYNTFEDLAAAANVSPTTIGTGTDSYSWRSSTLDAIANALGCSPLDILTVDEVIDSKRNEDARRQQRILKYDRDFALARQGHYTEG